MIHKYHLADVLTLTETLLSVVLFGMAIAGAPVDWALWTFVSGEVCDALDGPCARRWHYPNDGKFRWWRKYNSEIDQASDIALAIACGTYLIARVSWQIGLALLGGIGVFCLLVQLHLYYYDTTVHEFKRRGQPYTAKLIKIRRRIYVVGGVGGAITTLVWYSSWKFAIKLGLTISAPLIVLICVKLKSNRWHDDKTPL